MSQFDLKIGPKIKAFRRQLGRQANKLAEQLEISPSYLNLIEGGKRKIDGDLLLKICEELKIELSDLTSKSKTCIELLYYDFHRRVHKLFSKVVLKKAVQIGSENVRE